jgi:transcriptional regulator with XRE-family HTH domain
MRYNSKEQLIIEFKKILLDKQISQREVAQRLGITPQALTKIINKQNFSFDDMEKLLHAVEYDMDIRFTPADSQAPNDVPIRMPEPEPQQQVTTPQVHKPQYRKFTPEETAKIDTSRLLTDARYQVQIVSDFGIEVFNALVEKAQKESDQKAPAAGSEE